jgi:type IV pilus assembly protein PilA
MSISTALKARRAQLRDREAGFTLIELLVVVIIIGILAAIAIPVYIGVQNNAKDSAIKSDLTNAKTAYSAYVADKGTVPAIGDLKNYGYSSGTASLTIAPASGTDTFCLSGTSAAGNAFYISTTKPVTTGSCPSTSSTW